MTCTQGASTNAPSQLSSQSRRMIQTRPVNQRSEGAQLPTLLSDSATGRTQTSTQHGKLYPSQKARKNPAKESRASYSEADKLAPVGCPSVEHGADAPATERLSTCQNFM